MNISVENNCKSLDWFNVNIDYILYILNGFLYDHPVKSLKYFVISANENEDFAQTVEKTANLLNTNIYLENNEYYSTLGQTIEGTDENGELCQAIIIREGTIVKLIKEIALLQSDEEVERERVSFDAIKLVMHEIGHTVDNENIYRLTHQLSTKICYNMSNPTEAKEFFRLSTLALWGEFAAESFVYDEMDSFRYFPSIYELELLNCVENYVAESPTARVYRILHMFVLILAKNGKVNFDYEIYSNTKIQKYSVFLKQVEKEIFALKQKYPNWDMSKDLNRLIAIYRLLVDFEIKQ